MTAPDPYNLARFVSAQEKIYDRALAEIIKGFKRSHWMWFVFPQLRGLGFSEHAEFYGISGKDEARAYLAHEVLGPRLLEISRAAINVEGRTARELFGTPDNLKLRSSATLFAQVSAEDSVFHQILQKYFEGKPDQKTLELLGSV